MGLLRRINWDLVQRIGLVAGMVTIASFAIVLVMSNASNAPGGELHDAGSAEQVAVFPHSTHELIGAHDADDPSPPFALDNSFPSFAFLFASIFTGFLPFAMDDPSPSFALDDPYLGLLGQDYPNSDALECGNLDHLLVVRQDFRLVCMTPESASRLDWPEVDFSDNNDVMVNSTLKVEADGEVYYMDYVITNGLVRGAERDDAGGALILKINSVKEGMIAIEIPKLFYTWAGPDLRNDWIITVQRGDPILEIPNEYVLVQGKYRVEFAFPNTDPEFEIIQFGVIAD